MLTTKSVSLPLRLHPKGALARGGFFPSPFDSCRMLLRCILIFALCAEWARAISVNRTIDDRYGDSVTGQLPQFMPNSWSKGEQCPGCHAQPDPKECHNGTWSDTTHHDGQDDGRNITMQFTGTAVYAYHVLAPQINGTDTITNLSFTLDGAPVDPGFIWVPAASDQAYQYNIPVYVNESLANTEHTFVIHLVGPVSLGLFDYVIYTFDDDGVSPSTPTSTLANPSPTPTATVPSSVQHSSFPIGAVIGGSVGGAVLILIIIATLVIHRRERQRSRAELVQKKRMTLESSMNSDPYIEFQNFITPEERDLWSAGQHSYSRTSIPHPGPQAPSEPDHRSPTISQAVSLAHPRYPMPVVPEYPMSDMGYTKASLTSGMTEKVSLLRNEVAVLRGEIVQLRQDRGMVMDDALPQYESHRGSGGALVPEGTDMGGRNKVS
ncbi:hypothetical protein C8Q74DRAFT_1372525 [Fomes fomentarius]|nr:hypothetical protein C8Q74DRAFT_1372525 [Fomes fomentarius]